MKSLLALAVLGITSTCTVAPVSAGCITTPAYIEIQSYTATDVLAGRISDQHTYIGPVCPGGLVSITAVIKQLATPVVIPSDWPEWKKASLKYANENPQFFIRVLPGNPYFNGPLLK